jgi:hypothetical protein
MQSRYFGVLTSLIGSLLLTGSSAFGQVPVTRPDSVKSKPASEAVDTKSVTDTLNKSSTSPAVKPTVVSPSTTVTPSKSAEKKAADDKEKKNGWSRPKRAAILSAVLPGLGQIYNGRIWKVPIIYAIGGGLGYLAYTNNSHYQDFRNATIARTDNNPGTVDPYIGRYTDQGLVVLRDYHRRNRDLSIIFMTFTYLLQILEANVDAHLKGFDVSDDLSLRISPAFIPQNSAAPVPGCSLSLTLR